MRPVSPIEGASGTGSSLPSRRRLRGKQTRSEPPAEGVGDGRDETECADDDPGDRQGAQEGRDRGEHGPHEADPEAGPELVPELIHHGPHRRPTGREIEEHNITHTPAKSWCSTCVAAKATDDPHRRRRPEEVDDQAQSEMAKVYFDYGFSGIEWHQVRYHFWLQPAGGPE